MAKASVQKESTKPKFQQTRLCFSAAVPSTDKKEDYAKKLETSIKKLNIGGKKKHNEHPDPCKYCNKSTPRIQCTAIKPNSSEPCTLSYCEACIKKWSDEDMKLIKSNSIEFVTKDGAPIKHRSVLTNSRWACLACRNICGCEFCGGKTTTKKPSQPMLSFNAKSSFSTLPKYPKLNEIQLLYPEEELWIRLQIREFVFRFGDSIGFDHRLLSSMQNVQGDWKIKRLGAHVVWQFLLVASQASQYDTHSSNSPEEKIPQKAKQIMSEWMADKKIPAMYPDTVSRHHAMLEVLNMEGMSAKRWQDIAELLALAQVSNIPIPTYLDLEKMRSNTDANAMDIDQDEEIMQLEKKIRRFQKSGRSLSLLSAQDELKMISMLLELLLHSSDVRQSLNTISKPKENRDMELDLKKYTKEYNIEDVKNKSKKSILSTRISQLKVIRGKEDELRQAQIELDELETLIRDERMSLETKKLELDVFNAKSQKRLEPAGIDKFGNEYWIFSDLLDHLNHATDYRNSEPYWAYGVIIIGPGYNEEEQEKEQEEGEKERKWWYIKGSQMSMLVDWAKQQRQQEPEALIGDLAIKVNQRIEHLKSLEWVVYGAGFFFSS